MKYLTYLFTGLACVLSCSEAYAYSYCISSTGVAVLSESTTAGGTAHMIEANGTDCSNLCTANGGRRAYIDFADKELFAAALTNSYSGTSPSTRRAVVISWETGAPSKGSVVNGAVTCKVVAMNQ